MEHISLLKNPVQKYAWGSRTALQSLLGWHEPWEEPAAELWMGAHPKAPSEVEVDGEWRSLIDVIGTDPVSVLGADAARTIFQQTAISIQSTRRRSSLVHSGSSPYGPGTGWVPPGKPARYPV